MKLVTCHYKREMLIYSSKLLTGGMSKKVQLLPLIINFDEWTSILQGERVASAIVDRLLHHAHVISISGDSYRLRHHIQMME